MASVVGVPNLIVLALVTAVVGLVFRERLWAANPVGRISWSSAWLKAAVVVVFAIIFVAYVPSRVLQSGSVASLDRSVQDLIGSAVWAAGLVVLLAGLRILHRGRRV